MKPADWNDAARDGDLPPHPEAWAEDMPPPPEDGAPPEPEPEVDVATWRLCYAVESWLWRLSRPASRAVFPWPGGRTDEPERDRLPLDPGALRPMPADSMPRWDALWRIAGPLREDRCAVVVGRPKRGKSALAVQVAEAAARAGCVVLYASAEMGADELVARMVALRAQGTLDGGIAYSALLARAEPGPALKDATDALVGDCPNLYLWAPANKDRNLDGLEAAARAVSAAHGGAPLLVVVDYVQRFAVGEDRRVGTSDISGRLRALSRPGGLFPEWPGAAVLALSSTSRANYQHFQSCDTLRAAFQGGEVEVGVYKSSNTEKGYRAGDPKVEWREPIPLEGMGKETGELEYDATLTICMTWDKPDEPGEPGPFPALLVVAANRMGPEGTVDLALEPASGRFTEAQPRKRITRRRSANMRPKREGFEPSGADRAANDYPDDYPEEL